MTMQPQPVKQAATDRQYSGLRWHLLLSYLAVMTATFGISGVAIYGLFVKSLYQQVDHRLAVLADAAAHSLSDIQQRRIDPTLIETPSKHPPLNSIDQDGNLDVSWHKLRSLTQGIEWFDGQQHLLARSGQVFAVNPIQPEIHLIQNNQIRSLTLPIYNHQNGQLQGYVRVSEAMQSLEAEFSLLQWVLGLGGIVALGLTGVGSVWLAQQSLQPIRRSLQQLKQFTADASHELRSPLTAVKLSVDVLRNDSDRLHPEDRRRVEAIATGVDQIRFLVENLLLLTQIDADQAKSYECRPIAIEEVLDDLLELLELQAEERQITLKANLLPDAIVNGDATQLPRLFINLLDNALKYTPVGGTVTVSMQRTARTITVSIEDTGMGIAPEHLPHVFDRFWRADAARTGDQQGLGLGLTIAQAIAHYHRGEISVTSQLGVGSCFGVRLPLV